jgi:hypothetical protein
MTKPAVEGYASMRGGRRRARRVSATDRSHGKRPFRIEHARYRRKRATALFYDAAAPN